jgi:hypothetical protein
LHLKLTLEIDSSPAKPVADNGLTFQYKNR